MRSKSSSAWRLRSYPGVSGKRVELQPNGPEFEAGYLMQKTHTGILWSGTSGLVLPVPNKQHFPPAFQDKSRLAYYASLFNSIEINSSFYKIPQANTVKKWADSVPAAFRFTFKLWREITHTKGLIFQPADVLRFMEVISQAGDKKGCLLVQFPPSTTVEQFAQVEQLLEILQSIHPAHDWPIALEFRHPSWYIGEVYELADEYACSIVLHDIPKSRNQTVNKKASFVYLRFHGPTGDYRGSYTDTQLRLQADAIGQWLEQGKDVYTYFNNTAGDAVKNLVTLNSAI